MVVAVRWSACLFALGVACGCGRTAAHRGMLGDGGEGGAAGTSTVTTGGAVGTDGGSALGGKAQGGFGTGGEPEKPVDPSLPPPTLRLPHNGRATGSVWSARALRPRFLWEPTEAFTFEIQVDDSCNFARMQSCAFPSPEWSARELRVNEATPERALPASDMAPVGRRYYWRVRSCHEVACSPWSSVRYLDVGRQHSDFDGDGFADVVLADAGSIARQGRVWVAFGPVSEGRRAMLTGSEAADAVDRFGQVAMPLGDVDADGFADLLVVAPGDELQQPGVAHVFFGSVTFGDPSTQARLLIEPADVGGRIIAGSPAGDVDADGLQDFVLAVQQSKPQLLRSAGRRMKVTSFAATDPEVWPRMAWAGDVTGDGHADLLVASSGKTYELWRGTPTGFEDTALISQVAGFPNASWSIVGDVNGDGFSDLGQALNDEEHVSDFHIEVTWGAEKPSFGASAVTWPGGLVGSYGTISHAIPAGDVNGDGFDDSLAGIDWHGSDLAQVNLYLGGVDSRATPDAVYAYATGELLFITEGLASAPGDVNGDGFDDVLVSENVLFTARLFFGGEVLDVGRYESLTLPAP